MPVSETDVEYHLSTTFEPTTGVEALFEPFDCTDISSNSFEIHVPEEYHPDDTRKHPSSIGEGEHSASVSYSNRTTIPLTFDKYGFIVDTEEDDVEDLKRLIHWSRAARSYNALQDVYEKCPNGWGYQDSPIDAYEEAIYRAASQISFNDQDVLLVSDVLQSYIASQTPGRDSDEIRVAIEDEYDVRVVVDEYNLLGAGDMIVADTDFLGYRGVRTEPEYDSWGEYDEYDRFDDIPEEEEPDRTIYQSYQRCGTVVVSPEAGYICRLGML